MKHMTLSDIKNLSIEDGIFRGSTTFGDGYEFTFDITREEIVRFLLDHKKGRLVYDKKNGNTLLSDNKLITNYCEQYERVRTLERRKENPSQRGGYREGAGRKPKDKAATQHITVRVRKDLLEVINSYYENKRSDFIQRAIKNQLKRDGLI